MQGIHCRVFVFEVVVKWYSVIKGIGDVFWRVNSKSASMMMMMITVVAIAMILLQ
jgi:hypothetical protein